MNPYTVSKLACDAGVSVHIVRDYEARGLLRTVGRTECGYCVYHESAAERVRFVQAGLRAGIFLTDLVELCRAFDAREPRQRSTCVARMKAQIAVRREALAGFEACLDGLGRAPDDVAYVTKA